MPVLKVHATPCDIEHMVHSDDLRAAFVARLKKALAHANIAEWGAGVRLAKMAKATPKAASKWLNAEAMPGRSNMQAIADELRVRVEWLQYGEGAMTDEGRAAGYQSIPSNQQIASIDAAESRGGYKDGKYQSATPEHRQAVDDLVDQLLDLSPEQALKVKQAMELLMPPHDARKD